MSDIDGDPVAELLRERRKDVVAGILTAEGA